MAKLNFDLYGAVSPTDEKKGEGAIGNGSNENSSSCQELLIPPGKEKVDEVVPDDEEEGGGAAKKQGRNVSQVELESSATPVLESY